MTWTRRLTSVSIKRNAWLRLTASWGAGGGLSLTSAVRPARGPCGARKGDRLTRRRAKAVCRLAFLPAFHVTSRAAAPERLKHPSPWVYSAQWLCASAAAVKLWKLIAGEALLVERVSSYRRIICWCFLSPGRLRLEVRGAVALLPWSGSHFSSD